MLKSIPSVVKFGIDKAKNEHILVDPSGRQVGVGEELLRRAERSNFFFQLLADLEGPFLGWIDVDFSG